MLGRWAFGGTSVGCWSVGVVLRHRGRFDGESDLSQGDSLTYVSSHLQQADICEQEKLI